MTDGVFFSFVLNFSFFFFFVWLFLKKRRRTKQKEPKKRGRLTFDSFGIHLAKEYLCGWAFFPKTFYKDRKNSPPHSPTPAFPPRKKNAPFLRASSCPLGWRFSDLRDEEMEGYYWTQFGVLAVLCTVMEFKSSRKRKKRKCLPLSWPFQKQLFARVFADDGWRLVARPVRVRVVSALRYTTGDIGKLFIAGFGEFTIFGTVVGSMADKQGRKAAALVYVVTYIVSCVTKHWSDYYVLMPGDFWRHCDEFVVHGV